MKFDFFADPSHGWIKVKKSLLEKLGIADKITPYSYMKGEYAYLEEDSDATKFVEAMKAAGIEVEFREHVTDNESKIRLYQPYRRL
jgi:ABC-type transport system substrate-binding protein